MYEKYDRSSFVLFIGPFIKTIKLTAMRLIKAV